MTNLSRTDLEAIGVKFSKNGYIIASPKNLGRIFSSMKFSKARMSRFDSMTDGMGPLEDAIIAEAKDKSYEIVLAGRYGRGIAVYEAQNGQPACVSVGDCCYDVNLYL